MRTVALIPARGGSKGIKDKNLQLVCGKPLIAHTVSTALDSIVEEVWVSTNCDKIKEAAEQANAQVLMRPENICLDTSKSEEALLHFADNVEFDRLVFLQCTTPLTIPEDINAALKLMDSYDSIISVFIDRGGWLCNGFNWVEKNGIAERVDKYYHHRENKPVEYRENGAVYVTTRDQLLSSKSRISGKIGLYVMPRQRSFDIDDWEDLEEVKEYMKRW